MWLGLSLRMSNGTSASGTVGLVNAKDAAARWNPLPDLDLSIRLLEASFAPEAGTSDRTPLDRAMNSIELLTKAYNDLAGPVQEELTFLRSKCALLESMVRAS